MSSSTPLKKPAEKKDDKSVLVALIFFISAAGLILYCLFPTAPSKVNPQQAKILARSKAQQYDDKVNRHLMLTSENMEMQRQKMAVENKAYAPDYDSTRPGMAYQNPTDGVDLSIETHAEEVAKALGRGTRETDPPKTPQEMIQSELFNEQQYQAYSQAYKDEYARQFVENAARQGWNVKLNADFRVISVTPLRVPSNQGQLFQNGETGGSASQ